MDVNKIVQLRLLRDKFKKIPFTENYSVQLVDIFNYKNYISQLINISELMKSDFDWIGIPDEATLHRRFQHNSHCLLWIYNSITIGWAWSNYNVTPYWEKSIQELNDKEIYGGGAFLSKKVDRPTNSGLIFYNLTFDYWLNKMDNNCIYQYSDTWNRASSILSYKNGFDKFNYLN